MFKLTKREEEYMQVLWSLEKAFIKDIIERLPDPKPHYNTVSTIVKILEEKGFVSHESIGNSHRYFPIIQKETYQQRAVNDVVTNYFDNSYLNIVTYFAKKEKISAKELEEVINLIKKDE